MATEWTEADKGAHIRFVDDVRALRNYVENARFVRVEVPTSEVYRRLQAALDRLGAK